MTSSLWPNYLTGIIELLSIGLDSGRKWLVETSESRCANQPTPFTLQLVLNVTGNEQMPRCQFLLRSAWIFMMWTLIVVSINQIELCFVEMVENRGVGSGIDVEALLPICVEFQLIYRTNTGNLKSEWKEKVAESKSRRKVRAAKKVKARKSKSGTNKCHFPCDFQWAAPTEPTAPHALPFWATGGWRVAGENIREQKEWLKMGPGMGGGGW